MHLEHVLTGSSKQCSRTHKTLATACTTTVNIGAGPTGAYQGAVLGPGILAVPVSFSFDDGRRGESMGEV